MKSRRLIEMSLYEKNIYNMLGMEEKVEYKGESFPQAPDPQAATDKKK